MCGDLQLFSGLISFRVVWNIEQTFFPLEAVYLVGVSQCYALCPLVSYL